MKVLITALLFNLQFTAAWKHASIDCEPHSRYFQEEVQKQDLFLTVNGTASTKCQLLLFTLCLGPDSSTGRPPANGSHHPATADCFSFKQSPRQCTGQHFSAFYMTDYTVLIWKFAMQWSCFRINFPSCFTVLLFWWYYTCMDMCFLVGYVRVILL